MLRCLQVVAHDQKFEDYAVVHFAATPFTEEGIDIVTRAAGALSAEQQHLIMDQLKQHPDIQRLLTAKSLFAVARKDASLSPVHNSDMNVL